DVRRQEVVGVDEVSYGLAGKTEELGIFAVIRTRLRPVTGHAFEDGGAPLDWRGQGQGADQARVLFGEWEALRYVRHERASRLVGSGPPAPKREHYEHPHSAADVSFDTQPVRDLGEGSDQRRISARSLRDDLADPGQLRAVQGFELALIDHV